MGRVATRPRPRETTSHVHPASPSPSVLAEQRPDPPLPARRRDPDHGAAFTALDAVSDSDGGALPPGRARGIDRRRDVGLDGIADGGVGRDRIGDGGAGRDGVGDGGAGRDRVIGRGRGVDGDAGGIDDNESRHGVFPNAIGARFCRG